MARSSREMGSRVIGEEIREGVLEAGEKVKAKKVLRDRVKLTGNGWQIVINHID